MPNSGVKRLRVNTGDRRDNAQQPSKWLCNQGLVLQGQRRVATRIQRVVTFMAETRPFTIEGNLERSVGSWERTTPVTAMLNRLVAAMDNSASKWRDNCAQWNMINEKWSGRGVNFTIHAHLALRLRMSGDVPLLPLYAFMMWAGKNLPLPF
jgi:hypothetical protein